MDNVPPGYPTAMSRARNYQQEMFEESMKRNIIIAMDTGSGKTHIAIMRIQAQLQCSDKLSWFLAPGVALSDQQREFLEQYLPPGTVQFITGNHGVDTWSTKKIWNQALSRPVMVTTPQVLYDALCHGFVHINHIGLLVFDEAHHCRSKHPYNLIMQEFYHRELAAGGEVPAILGLSASPIIKTQSDLSVIEGNLNAIVRTPIVYREELMQHVHRPTLKFVEYNIDDDFIEHQPQTTPAPSQTLLLNSSAKELKRSTTPGTPVRNTKRPKGASWLDHLDAATVGNLPHSTPNKSPEGQSPATLATPSGGSMKPKGASWLDHLKPNAAPKLSERLLNTIFDDDCEILIMDDDSNDDEIRTPPGASMHEPMFPNLNVDAVDIGQDQQSIQTISTVLPQRRICAVFRSLEKAYEDMDIMHDPYVLELKQQKSPDLLKTISSRKTDSQEHMKRLVSSARHLLEECGHWAVEWFITEVVKKFLSRNFMELEDTVSMFEGEEAGFWRTEAEEIYLRDCLAKVQLPETMCNIETNVSAKVQKFLDVLLDEYSAEEHEEFSGLVFANQRVAVAALAKIICEHPKTKNIFKVGTMVGSSVHASKKKRFIHELVGGRRNNSLAEFRKGEKNLLVATAAIQEGVDVPDCHLVICFDLPNLLVEYIQRRGRARRSSSSYVLMFSSTDANRIAEFERTEKKMIEHYMDQEREASEEDTSAEIADMLIEREMRIEKTGALLNLGNAIPHLTHFCDCLPHREFVDLKPEFRTHKELLPDGEPCWSAEVVLPNAAHHLVQRASSIHYWRTEKGAKKEAAFESYKLLYENNLINDNLMPLHKYDESQEDKILKRPPKMQVTERLDPWEIVEDKWEEGNLFTMDIDVEFGSGENVGVQMMLPMEVEAIEGLQLYWTQEETAKVTFGRCEEVKKLELMDRAKKASYRLFKNMYSRKMQHDEDTRYNFAYLFAPREGDNWDDTPETHIEALEVVGKDRADIGVVRDYNGTPYIFRQFRKDLSILESDEFKGHSSRDPRNVRQDQPLIEVQRVSKRRDFLHPEAGQRKEAKILLLLPEFLFIDTLPWRYTQLSLFVPFLVDRVEKAILAADLKNTLQFKGLPGHLVVNAVTASSARDPIDYQRLEFLGDSVLKVLTSIALVDEYPLWHEGYLTGGKDRVVSNTVLSQKSHDLALSRWINTTPVTGLKWSPRYRATATTSKNLDPTPSKSLSTKVLADVVESLIGVAYLTSGYSGAIEVCSRFDLSSSLFPWHPLEMRIDSLVAIATENDRNYRRHYPDYFQDLQQIIGYTFSNRALLLEAITHVSFGGDSTATSYQRLEFLGDSLLDMVIVKKLYKWPRKQLTHIQMHHLKSASVNAHFLAFLCLTAGTEIERPEPDENAQQPVVKKRRLSLPWFLRHSHSELARSQVKTSQRYEELKASIQEKLDNAPEYPWEDLHSLDAPKHLSDMIESIAGAIWIDSKGSFRAVEQFLERLGVLNVLERLVMEDVIVDHPLSRFGILAASDGRMRTTKYTTEQVTGAEWKCELRVNDELLVDVIGVNRAHARTRAARLGLDLLAEKDRKVKEEMDKVEVEIKLEQDIVKQNDDEGGRYSDSEDVKEEEIIHKDKEEEEEGEEEEEEEKVDLREAFRDWNKLMKVDEMKMEVDGRLEEDGIFYDAMDSWD